MEASHKVLPGSGINFPDNRVNLLLCQSLSEFGKKVALNTGLVQGQVQHAEKDLLGCTLLLGGSWNLVTTCNWGSNPTCN